MAAVCSAQRFLHNAGDLQAAGLAKGDVESPFDSALLIEIGGAGANEEDAYHKGEDVLTGPPAPCLAGGD
jgi:hypothetical protein